MAETTTYDPSAEIERLLEEIVRYLAAVEEYRRQGHEPRWRTDERAERLAGR